jgi:chaperonin GroES
VTETAEKLETSTDLALREAEPLARILDAQIVHLDGGGTCREGLDYVPYADRIVVAPRREERDINPHGEEKLGSGLIKPAMSDRGEIKPEEGRVVAVGPGRRYWNGDLVRCAVKVGDWVVYERNSGSPVTIDGVVYLEMFERSIKGHRPTL